MNKKANLGALMYAPFILFMAIIILIAVMVGLEQRDLSDQKKDNLEDIGLSISDEERECYDFCKGSPYWFTPSSRGGLFDSGYPERCECKPTLVRIERVEQ